MRNPRKTTTAVLAGAALLASGAYAIGSQQGDGGAFAAAGDRASSTGDVRPLGGPPLGGPPPGAPPGGERFGHRRGGRGGPPAVSLRRLARKLGVSTAELRSALRDVRPERPSHDVGPGERFSGLADKLGVSEEQLRDALEQI